MTTKAQSSLDKAVAPPFGVGDMLPDIILPNNRSRMVQFMTHVDDVRQILLFCPDPRQDACRKRLESFARAFAALESEAMVFGVTNSTPEENAAFLDEHPLPFYLLSDLQRQVAAGLGITHNLEAEAAPSDGTAFSIVVCDINRRVLKIARAVAEPDPAPAILDFLRELPKPKPRTLSGFAPVLMVPQALEPEFCRALIAAFESGHTQPSGFQEPSGPLGESAHVIDPLRKSRRDHLVSDPALLEGIRMRLARRVFPEIEKALTRVVVGAEQFKVVRYDAEDGGHFSAHRDNVVRQHAHRRFAMTLNLNAGEYEGGALRFPEYGPDLYQPGIGDAVIFSCSLLHRAMPVTKGHRYVLLAFFFDDESRRLNDRYRA